MGLRKANDTYQMLTVTTAQDDLIASLKKELAAQRSLAAESKSLKSQVAELNAAKKQLSSESKQLSSENKQLSSENKQLSFESKSLNAKLSESQAEVKTLTAKLAATRASSANPESKVPGSAVKAQRSAMLGGVEAAKDSQIRQLKEDLYSDLTGLIVRGVKRGEDEDIYDCIQTGRNGSKFFRDPKH